MRALPAPACALALAVVFAMAAGPAQGAGAARAAQDSTPPLAELLRTGDRDAAMRALRAGADVNVPQGDGTTALHWAAYKVDVELARELLKRGAKANVKNDLGSTPLAEAVKVSNVELTRMLVEAGADVESANEDGQTALMLAARNGSLEIAQLLVAHGANVNARETWRGQTALMWAVAENQPGIAELLIAKGADVSARAVANDWGNQVTSEPRAQYRPSGGLTVLLYAARAGCQRCVDALLGAGADIDLPSPDGITALMIAIDNQHFDLARHLLDRGANPHVWDWWGRTALYVAVDVSSMVLRGAAGGFGGVYGAPEGGPRGPTRLTAVDTMKLLLAKGVNPNPQLNMHRPGRGGNSGRFTDDLQTAGATPLLLAALSFDTAAAKVLLEGGALVDLGNAMGVTPLMAAAGIGVSVRDPRSRIYTAPDAQKRSIETMDLLLKAGANVNARIADTSGRTARIARPSTMTSRQGQTALYGAINWGWTQVVQYLLDHGARVDVLDAAGRSPLDATSGNAGGRDHKRVDEIVALVTKAGGKPGRGAAPTQPAGAPAATLAAGGT